VDGYDEIPPAEQQVVAEYFKVIIKNYPKARIVTTGTPEYLDGLIPLGFAPLVLSAWTVQQNQAFIERWGQIWSQTVAKEAWSQTGAEQVDPILLNVWLSADNLHLSPLELTLKVWGAYAGDSLGSHVLESIATHIRRLAPVNTPLAALETLALQVMLSAQPVFDPRKARDWVKSFEVADEIAESEFAEQTVEETEEPKEESNQKREQKRKRLPHRQPACSEKWHPADCWFPIQITECGLHTPFLRAISPVMDSRITTPKRPSSISRIGRANIWRCATLPRTAMPANLCNP
jgi:hypothetical protein